MLFYILPQYHNIGHWNIIYVNFENTSFDLLDNCLVIANNNFWTLVKLWLSSEPGQGSVNAQYRDVQGRNITGSLIGLHYQT